MDTNSSKYKARIIIEIELTSATRNYAHLEAGIIANEIKADRRDLAERKRELVGVEILPRLSDKEFLEELCIKDDSYLDGLNYWHMRGDPNWKPE